MISNTPTNNSQAALKGLHYIIYTTYSLQGSIIILILYVKKLSLRLNGKLYHYPHFFKTSCIYELCLGTVSLSKGVEYIFLFFVDDLFWKIECVKL